MFTRQIGLNYGMPLYLCSSSWHIFILCTSCNFVHVATCTEILYKLRRNRVALYIFNHVEFHSMKQLFNMFVIESMFMTNKCNLLNFKYITRWVKTPLVFCLNFLNTTKWKEFFVKLFSETILTGNDLKLDMMVYKKYFCHLR